MSKNKLYTILLNAFLTFLALLPFRINQALGFILGQCFILFANKPKRIAKKNIALCFPELSDQQRQQLLNKAMIETAKTVTELGALWRWPEKKLLKLVKQVDGEAYIEQALASEQGVIIAAPHLGAWELLGGYCNIKYSPVTYLYRPPRQVWVENIMHQTRERLGAKLVPTDIKGVRAIYRALASNQLVGILPDHEASIGDGVFVPFFNVQCSTPVLLPRLANKTKAQVIVAYAERLPWGRGFHLHFSPVEAAIYNKDPIISATAMNAAVEACIRQIPTQYQWNYKRFRSQPGDLMDRAY